MNKPQWQRAGGSWKWTPVTVSSLLLPASDGLIHRRSPCVGGTWLAADNSALDYTPREDREGGTYHKWPLSAVSWRVIAHLVRLVSLPLSSVSPPLRLSRLLPQELLVCLIRYLRQGLMFFLVWPKPPLLHYRTSPSVSSLFAVKLFDLHHVLCLHSSPCLPLNDNFTFVFMSFAFTSPPSFCG